MFTSLLIFENDYTQCLYFTNYFLLNVDVKSDKKDEKTINSPVAASSMSTSIPTSTPTSSTSSVAMRPSVSESKHIHTDSQAEFPPLRSSQSPKLHELD